MKRFIASVERAHHKRHGFQSNSYIRLEIQNKRTTTTVDVALLDRNFFIRERISLAFPFPEKFEAMVMQEADHAGHITSLDNRRTLGIAPASINNIMDRNSIRGDSHRGIYRLRSSFYRHRRCTLGCLYMTLIGIFLVNVRPSLGCFCCYSSYTIISNDGSSTIDSFTHLPLSPFSRRTPSSVAALTGLRTRSSLPYVSLEAVRRRHHRTQTHLADKKNGLPWSNLGGEKDKEDNNNPKEIKKQARADQKQLNTANTMKKDNEDLKKKGKISRILSAVGSVVKNKKPESDQLSSSPPSSSSKRWFRTKSTNDQKINNAVAAVEERLASVRTELLRLQNQKQQISPEPEQTNRLVEVGKALEELRDRLLEEDSQRKDRRERNAKKAPKGRDDRVKKEKRVLKAEKGENATNTTNAMNVVAEAFDGARSFVGTAWENAVANRPQWVPVCRKTRVSPGEVVPVVAGGMDLLIVASKDGLKLHCIANSCPHLGTPLEIGTLERRKIDNKFIGPEIPSRTGGLPTTSLKKIPPSKDGCEECIVCPLHKTAFALESGEVRGEWCPYPPILGKMVGNNKNADTKLPTFELRTRGKNIEVRVNSDVDVNDPYKKS